MFFVPEKNSGKRLPVHDDVSRLRLIVRISLSVLDEGSLEDFS